MVSASVYRGQFFPACQGPGKAADLDKVTLQGFPNLILEQSLGTALRKFLTPGLTSSTCCLLQVLVPCYSDKGLVRYETEEFWKCPGNRILLSLPFLGSFSYSKHSGPFP